MTADRKLIFLDPNFIFYLVERGESFDDVFASLSKKYSLCTDVRALQEIVFRYHLMGETSLGYRRAKQVRENVHVLNVTDQDINTLEELMTFYPRHIPRELLHVSTMVNNDINQIICAPDSSYKEVDGVKVRYALSEASHQY